MHAKYVPVAMIALSAASATIAQETPNITPGMWETTSTVTIQSEQFPIPPRTETTTECVTPEKIKEGQAFLEDNEECEFTRKDIRSDGMDYAMNCSTPDGGKFDMQGAMEFGGDTMSGTISGTIESPMGVMQMSIELDGKRTGDC